MSAVLEHIRRRFAFSKQEFTSYVKTAPYRYKTYPIAKRSGGTREISQPSKDLKVIQRFVLAEFLEKKFKYHECATAYRHGKNISDNARPHLSNSYLLKMDFKDFFPSIRSSDFVRYLQEMRLIDSEFEAEALAMLFFKQTHDGLRLSIGSPGSPSISNALLMPFDDRVQKATSMKGISYTRYSDDLTFSTSSRDVLFELPSVIDEILSTLAYPKLEINREKTVFSSRKFNRHITGITISNEAKMSIGHQVKRRLRSKIFEIYSLQPKEVKSLKGYLSFVNQIEPDFIAKLKIKYPEQMKFLDATAAKPQL